MDDKADAQRAVTPIQALRSPNFDPNNRIAAPESRGGSRATARRTDSMKPSATGTCQSNKKKVVPVGLYNRRIS
jgi:hypothetical protein